MYGYSIFNSTVAVSHVIVDQLAGVDQVKVNVARVVIIAKFRHELCTQVLPTLSIAYTLR